MPVTVVERNDKPDREQRRGPKPLEGLPPQPKRPDLNALNDKIKKVRDEIEDLQKKVKDVEAKQEEARKPENDPRRALREQRSAIITDKKKLLDDIEAKRKVLQGHYDQSRAQRDASRRESREAQQMHREVGDIVTEEELNKKIKQLEQKLESGSAGNGAKGERRLIQEIRALEAKRPKIREVERKLKSLLPGESAPKDAGEELTAAEAIDKLKKDLDVLRAQVGDKIEQVKKLDADIAAVQFEDPNTKLREDRTKLREQVNKKYDEIRSLNDGFTKEKADYEVAMKDWKELRETLYQKRRAEREAEDEKRREADRKQKDEIEKIKLTNPHKDEIDTCNILIQMLQKKVGLKPVPARKEVTRSTAEFDPMAAVAGKKLQVLKKDDDDGSLFFGKKKKAAAPAKTTTAAAPKAPAKKVDTEAQQKEANSRKVTLQTADREKFDSLGVEAPKTVGEIKQTIKLLQEKQTHFESFKKTDAEVTAMLLARRKEKEAAAAKEAEAADEE